MPRRLLALAVSFRAQSNSRRLLLEAVRGAEAAGASVRTVDLAHKSIKPCRACDACVATGRCVFEDDDFLTVLDEVAAADGVLVATPVYYMAAPAQLKLFVDRTQCLFNMTYRMKRRRPPDEVRRRRGGVIAVCGSRLKDAFVGLDLTMKYLFDSLQMTLAEKLYVPHVDSRGQIERQPERLAEARDLGRRLAAD